MCISIILHRLSYTLVIRFVSGIGKISNDCTATADLLLVIDKLFDSLNGSYKNSQKRSGKPLLLNVTPTSEHEKTWKDSKIILKSMRFLAKNGKECSVPSIKNWIHTLDNMLLVKSVLFDNYKMKSIWCRHFNQDPLENYFGSIRRHGSRNTNPSVAVFESAFVSLLVKNISSTTVNTNCEKDSCNPLPCMKKIFFSKSAHEKSGKDVSEINFEDVDNQLIDDFNVKKQNTSVFSLLEYISGVVLQKAQNKIFKNCLSCKENFFDKEKKSVFIKIKEFCKTKSRLKYPNQGIVCLVSEIHDVAYKVIQRRSSIINLKAYLKTILYVVIDTSFLDCAKHKNALIDFFFDFCCRFFIFTWCNESNKLLRGEKSDTDDGNDPVHLMAKAYYLKRAKNKRKYNKTN